MTDPSRDHLAQPPGAGTPAQAASPRRRRLRAAASMVRKGTGASFRLIGTGTRSGAHRFQRFAGADGADQTGLDRLVSMHSLNVAGDAALTVSLAGTMFAMPTGEARDKVAIFLALTMAPFVLLAPLIGPLLDRFRHGRRWAIGGTLAARAFLAWTLASALVHDSAWIFPIALGALMASKAYAVTRASAVPRLLPEGVTLVKANSRLNIAGLLGMLAGGAVGGGLSRVGPDWSLRAAFVFYILATVASIRLPDRVDSAKGELDFAPEADDPDPLSRPRRRLRALPRPVRYTLWLCTGARLLSGFLVLYLGFLLREHPPPGMSGTVLLGLVAGSAALGNATGNLIGNRKRTPAPQILSTVTSLVAISAVIVVIAFFSPWTLVVLGLVAGLFSQLAKLSLDALIGRHVPDRERARVFSWSETILQAFWVFGGGFGILLPLEPLIGFTTIGSAIALTIAIALWSRRLPRPVTSGAEPATPSR